MTWMWQVSRRASRSQAAWRLTNALQLGCRDDMAREVAAAAAQHLGAAGVTAAAGPGGSGGGGRGNASTSSTGSGGSSKAHSADNTSQLAILCGKFKSRAHANDATGAERYYRAYAQRGGEPQTWMLAMLLGTYGRLRQADKAWAIYQQLLAARQGGGQAGGQQQQQQQKQKQKHASAQAQVQQAGAAGVPLGPSAAARGGAFLFPRHQGSSVQRRHPRDRKEPSQPSQPPLPLPPALAPQQEQQLWQQRAEQRQAALEAEAARLVRELRLAEVPLGPYAYGALMTALSRAEHPPYDLPAHYAEKAARAFADMRAVGVEPNVVLWHNLIDCQAKAGLPDAALATYRAMVASGAQPTSWTFSMLVSACGRAEQPHRAADVVDRLMSQARVTPELAVWNALLGAYGRAGSVDAAYAAWLKMLDSGAIPDDCTERVLALAFGSHPALAAEVVAEARAIRQQRECEAAAAAAAAAAAGRTAARQGGVMSGAQEQQQQGEGDEDGEGGGWRGEEGWAEGTGRTGAGSGETEGEATAAAAAAAGAAGAARWGAEVDPYRVPYRLHRHRQAPLAIDAAAAGGCSRGGGRHSPLDVLLPRQHYYQPRADGAADSVGDADSAAAATAAAEAEVVTAQRQQAAEERGLQLRQLLVLDLHGSSQAAARMVLLRRLEAMVLQAPNLEAEMARMEEQWRRHRLRQQHRRQLKAQQRVVAQDLLQVLGGGTGEGAAAVAEAEDAGGCGGQQAKQQRLPPPPLPQQQQQHEWGPVLGLQWADAVGAAAVATQGGAAEGQQPGGRQRQRMRQEAQTRQAQQQEQQALRDGQDRQACFSPPPLRVITGMGRHSKGGPEGGGGGVLKAAVHELLQQQGLPVVEDPANPGVVLVPWPALTAYLQQQRQAMHTDRFLTAARVRYMYVAAGVAGLMAAAHILPRLAPWMA